MSEALAFAVDDEVDLALRVEIDVLRPMPAGAAVNSLAAALLTANSTNSARSTTGAGGSGGRSASGESPRAPRFAASASPAARSERMPSIAIAAVEAPRNWSLKISSDSEPR
jgi:hypothetical protein